MKLWQKITFIAVLIVFVSASVTISLISVSRAPYKYEEQTAIGGEDGVDGWVFYGFNGNAATKTLYIDCVRDRDGNNPDETKPVLGVRAYATEDGRAHLFPAAEKAPAFGEMCFADVPLVAWFGELVQNGVLNVD